ncbi:MAG: TraR/DksA C4-type zinc finger protein [Nitrospirota bacterium]|nr:MAG: TraR/DksA C4-type zinc finger protein [Nitrospirota bacterium]
MTVRKKEELKKKVLDQIESLKTEIKSHEEASKPVSPDNAIGRLTRMEAINAKSISEASLSSARLRLKKLENTLKRIDRDDFGLCALCEEPIPLKRLMLMPETTKCVDCMEDS